MNRLNAAALCLLLAAGCGDSTGSTDTKGGAERDVTFVSGALLIPGDGSAPIEEATMIIENGMITQLGKKREFFAPKGSLPVELEGKTIAPLLVNLHAYPGLGGVQSFGADNYKRESLAADLNHYAYYGVGAVLAGGDSDGLAVQLRDEQRAGSESGALLFTSGRGIAARGSSGMMGNIPLLVGNEGEARKAVAELADRKVDAIVLWAEGMRPEAATAVIDEAHKRELKVFADAPNLAEAKNLVRANVDALISSVRDREVDTELASMMSEKKIPIAPALTALEARFVYGDSPRWLGESTMREVYPTPISAYLADPVIVYQFKRDSRSEAYRQEFETASSNLKKLADAGVPVAFGTGSGQRNTFPGYFEHREMELMVDAGLSPMDVITAATSVSANLLGAADLGALAVGKRGAFIVFASNPIEDITASKGIDTIYLRGERAERVSMIQNTGMNIPRVTPEDRARDAELRRQDAQQAAEAKMPHYGNGKFVLGTSVNVAPGLTIQTPRRSKATTAPGGPPYRVTVSIQASGADLRAFYADVLAVGKWSVAGNCWERAHPLQAGKRFRLCAEPSPNQIVLNINVQ
jgi:imidazolonepropionase-like amidohydrolase